MTPRGPSHQYSRNYAALVDLRNGLCTQTVSRDLSDHADQVRSTRNEDVAALNHLFERKQIRVRGHEVVSG